MRFVFLSLFSWALAAQAGAASTMGFDEGFAVGLEPLVRALSFPYLGHHQSHLRRKLFAAQFRSELGDGMVKSLSLALPFLPNTLSDSDRLAKGGFLLIGDLLIKTDRSVYLTEKNATQYSRHASPLEAIAAQDSLWISIPTLHAQLKSSVGPFLPRDSFTNGLLRGLEAPSQLVGRPVRISSDIEAQDVRRWFFRQIPPGDGEILPEEVDIAWIDRMAVFQELKTSVGDNLSRIEDAAFRKALVRAYSGIDAALQRMERKSFVNAEQRIRETIPSLERSLLEVLKPVYREFERTAHRKLAAQEVGSLQVRQPLFRCHWMFSL